MRDANDKEKSAYTTALANAAAIRTLGLRIAKPAVRAHVRRIADQTDRVLAVMRQDGNLAVAPLFNDHLLEPFKSLLTEYVRVSIREIRSADKVLATTETRDLSMIEQMIDDFYQELRRVGR